MRATINELLEKGIEILKGGDFSNPLLDVQLLLCYTLDVDKVYLFTHRSQEIEGEAVDKFLNLVEKRREGYPLQYIIKKQEFMGLDFYVDEGVLVPRPDTEILVEAIIDIVNRGYFGEKEITIVDIGTGSGAITLSLAHYIKNSFVYSVDISDKALRIAKENRRRLGLEDRVKFLKGDLFDPIEELGLKNTIDILVSNPPYIPSEEIDHLQREVASYEPRLALDGGEDGLDYYRRIVDNAPNYLSDNGILALEIGYNQGEDLKKMIIEQGSYKDVEIIKDLAGLDRVVIAKKQGTGDRGQGTGGWTRQRNFRMRDGSPSQSETKNRPSSHFETGDGSSSHFCRIMQEIIGLNLQLLRQKQLVFT